MSPEALQKIANYTFPGNIRELRNLLERAHILGHREEIAADELSVDDKSYTAPGPQKMEMRDWIRTLPASVDLRELLTGFEKGLIERALEQANGVQAEAARMLGVSRSDIGYKVAKYEIGRPAEAT
jgi:DNA-binding NtrC family response regulator